MTQPKLYQPFFKIYSQVAWTQKNIYNYIEYGLTMQENLHLKLLKNLLYFNWNKHRTYADSRSYSKWYS